MSSEAVPKHLLAPPKGKLWEVYKEKGEKVCTAMNKARDDSDHQDRAMMDLNVFEKDFRWAGSHDPHTGAVLEMAWEMESYKDREEGDDESGTCQFDNLHNVTSGEIQARINRRCDWPDIIDEHDDDATKKLKLSRYTPYHWSQVAWAQWTEACVCSNMERSSLKRVLRKPITNPISEKLMYDAVKPYLDANTFPKELVEITFMPHHEEFLPLLGSPNGNGVARLCMENTNALGGKCVSTITVRSYGGVSFEMELDLW